MDAPGCLTLGQASRSSYSNFPPLMSIHNFDTEFRQFLAVRPVVRSNGGIRYGIQVRSEELSAVETIGGVAQQPGMFVARGITSATKGIPLGEVWFPSRQWQFKPMKRVGVALAITAGVTGDFRPSSRGQWVHRMASASLHQFHWVNVWPFGGHLTSVYIPRLLSLHLHYIPQRYLPVVLGPHSLEVQAG